MSNVCLTHLSKSFGTVRAADDVTLTFPENRITAVVGESGCGKTTLLRLVAGLETPDAGSVSSTGEVAMVFQEPRLFPWLTVRENVLLAVRNLPESVRQARLEEALSLMRLTAAADLLPAQLSGGMAQRAGFARALASKPSVLLLDEAFSALDALTRTRVREDFLRVHAASPMTVVLVTHDILEACLVASTIVRLKNGRIEKTYALHAPVPRSVSNPEVLAVSEAVHSDFFHEESIP